MADKSQNITINYKFNTAEIDKANAILNRANQATNNLQASGQKAGQQIAAGFKPATQSLLQMQNQLARLKAQIEVSSNPKRIADLSNQFKTLKAQIDAANKSLFETAKASNNVKTSTASATQQFGSLFTAAKLFVAAGIAKETLSIALSLSQLAGNAEGVSRAFNRVFPDSVQLLQDLRDATHNTISDFELMQRTLQATNLGVGIKELPKLFEFAAARAQQTGESVDYLVDSIVRGIGRKSALILDNLGISAIRLKEELGGVSIQAASVGQVTEAVGKIAQEELTKMGGYAETAATKVAQLNASWENFKITLGATINSSGFVQKALNDVSRELKALSGDQLAAGINQLKNNRGIAEGAVVLRKFASEGGKIDLTWQELMSQGFLKNEQSAKKYEKILAQIQKEQNDLRLASESGVDPVTGLPLTGGKRWVPIEKEIETLEKLQEKARQLNEEFESIDASDIKRLSTKGREIIAINAQIEALEKLRKAAAGAGYEFNNFKLKPAFKFEFEKGTKTIAGVTYEVQRLKNEFGTVARQSDEFIADIEGITKAMENLKKALPAILDAPKNVEGASKTLETFVPKPGFWESLGEVFEENWKEILSEGLDIQTEFINQALEADLSSLKNRLGVLKNYYDEQQILAGDNERKKKELRLKEERETNILNKRIFEKEKNTRKAQAAIDGAAGIIKAFATQNFYVALVHSAIIAAKTIAEITAINRQKSGYYKGVIDLKGPGTATSDSIPANLSRGESVMTAWETRHAGDVLRDIRAKKLDNAVLRSLKQGRTPIQTQQFNDERIIKAIEKNRAPDVVEQSGIVYRVEKKSETYHRKIRSKSINL